MAADHGSDEAARRYRATVVTTLRQLRGLSEARLRLVPDLVDAEEAIRFWLLPRLAGSWQMSGSVFRSDGWEIDFGGERESFTTHASGDILCPFLGSRWVHAAMLGVGHSTGRVIGPAIGGGEYFRCEAPHAAPDLPPRVLPELPVMRTSDHWQEAIDSALGPALKRAWKEEGGEDG